MEANLQQVLAALSAAAQYGARWLVTSELALTGYHFDEVLGHDWIAPAPDRWLQRLHTRAASLGLTLFVGHPVLDPVSGARHNALVVLGADGQVVGEHRKIQTIPISEAWSTPGPPPRTVRVDSVTTGLLVCADAWPPKHARALASQGARVLISAANWAPGQYGPGDTWHRRSAETGLPLFVANRTGVDGSMDFGRSASGLWHAGAEQFVHRSQDSALVLLEWDLGAQRLASARVVPMA